MTISSMMSTFFTIYISWTNLLYSRKAVVGRRKNISACLILFINDATKHSFFVCSKNFKRYMRIKNERKDVCIFPLHKHLSKKNACATKVSYKSFNLSMRTRNEQSLYESNFTTNYFIGLLEEAQKRSDSTILLIKQTRTGSSMQKP